MKSMLETTIHEKPRGRRAGRLTALTAGAALMLAGCSQGSTESADSNKSSAVASAPAPAESDQARGYYCGEKRDAAGVVNAKIGDVAITFCYGGQGDTIVATVEAPTGEASHNIVGTYHGAPGQESTSRVSCQVVDGRAVAMPGTSESTPIWYKIADQDGVPGGRAEYVSDAFVKIDAEAASHLPLCK